MKLVRLLILISTLIFLGCTQDEENADSASEVSCSSVSGVWVISAVTCDGTAVESSEYENSSFNFASATSATQIEGASDCASNVPWDVTHGDFDASISLTGNGNLTCTANGSEVPSCSGAAANCLQMDVTGYQNNFETCALSNNATVMSINRTVSSTNNPNDLSFCEDGQVEVIEFAQGSSDPGSDLAVLDISGPDPADFGGVPLAGSAQLTLTVTNSGNADASALAASGLAAPFSFLGGAYPGTGGTCATTLASGSSCDLVVSFDPTANGPFNDEILIDYNDGAAAQQLTHGVQGVGGAPAVLIISETDPFDYGAVQVGNNNSHIFTVTNVGGTVATSITEFGLAFPFTFTGGGYPGLGGTCGVVLAPAANCTLQIEFAPTSLGVHADTIELLYNDGTAAQSATRDVMGTGTP